MARTILFFAFLAALAVASAQAPATYSLQEFKNANGQLAAKIGSDGSLTLTGPLTAGKGSSSFDEVSATGSIKAKEGSFVGQVTAASLELSGAAIFKGTLESTGKITASSGKFDACRK